MFDIYLRCLNVRDKQFLYVNTWRNGISCTTSFVHMCIIHDHFHCDSPRTFKNENNLKANRFRIVSPTFLFAPESFRHFPRLSPLFFAHSYDLHNMCSIKVFCKPICVRHTLSVKWKCIVSKLSVSRRCNEEIWPDEMIKGLFWKNYMNSPIDSSVDMLDRRADFIRNLIDTSFHASPQPSLHPSVWCVLD